MASMKSLSIADPMVWLDTLVRAESLQVLAAFGVCIALAWLLVWLVRRAFAGHELSVLLGKRLIDGVLFPTVLLGLTFVARALLTEDHPVALFGILLPVCISLALIRFGVKVLQVAFGEAPFVRMLERTISWIAWLAVVLWVTGILPLILEELDQIRWKVGGSMLSVRTLIEGALTAGAVLIFALWVSSALESRLLKSATGSDLSLRKVISNTVRALLMFVGLLLALSSVGIDLTALSVLGGAVGVGIGFGLQKLAANYVSGFVILAERSMRIGDSVKIDNFEGRITDIKARYTVIRSPSGRESIVPNEMLITQRVESLSLADSKVAQTTIVSVAYDAPVDQVMDLLLQACQAQPRVLADPAPLVALSAFGADGLEFTVNYWFEDPASGQLSLKSDINRAILKTLRENGIEIPFPQRVVHMPSKP
ncbi:mechanosensitive ion channel family protein [Limnohabitans sp. T6-20]|uniref:mechanosensitive ion channel family protein n=1 Tax=Limnohabitans sp. T6-20 TaxID=1100725 RepID=UPI000D3872DD|nr:mechanosensitive ion channel domain-containing protein [Limnohabitans sp. T6-20]PUE07891.1 mechanosensitive ion channel protein [Limnohabitans sp. T6-20]